MMMVLVAHLLLKSLLQQKKPHQLNEFISKNFVGLGSCCFTSDEREKLKIIAKKMNVPMEAMGLLPLDINEIPKIPKNPLQRDVSYHRTYKRK